MPRKKEVDAWFSRYDHPMKDAMLRVREIILQADRRLDECIKWQSPTFTFEGNLASFNPRTKKHVSLMFHTGAQIPGRHPRLEGGGDTARYMRIADMEDAESVRSDLVSIVKAWCDLKAGGATKPKKKAPAKKLAKKKPANKAAKKKPAKKAAKKAPAKKAAKKKPAKKATKKKPAKKAAKKKPAKKKT